MLSLWIDLWRRQRALKRRMRRLEKNGLLPDWRSHAAGGATRTASDTARFR